MKLRELVVFLTNEEFTIRSDNVNILKLETLDMFMKKY